MNKAPLKSKTTIQDLLDIIHLTIVKEKGENDVVLKEINAIGDAINNGTLTNYDINTPLYWTAIFKDVKDNGYLVTPIETPIKDQIVKTGETMWLIEEATDMETAMAAISMARVTGSVGSTEEHKNAEPPFGDGKRLKYAKVKRIEYVKPS